MNSQTLKMISLVLCFGPATQLFSQNVLYKDRHKQIEYNYAIVDSGTFDQLSETEKIKYELRYSETSHSTKINSDYSEETEIVYDSNGYGKDWLILPKRIVYDNSGITLYGVDGNVINKQPYTEQQLASRADDRINVNQQGYHPGISGFPLGNQSLYDQLAASGIAYHNHGSGKFSITQQGVTTTYDKQKLLITTERRDENGNLCRDYDGYVQMENGKGYLQAVAKTERSLKSERGLCLTEVKLVYYFDYQIQDFAGLIERTLQQVSENLLIVPNPNNGIFSVQVQLREGSIIQEIRLINMVTGHISNIAQAPSGSITVNRPDLESGYYAVQVVTNNSIVTGQFIKQ